MKCLLGQIKFKYIAFPDFNSNTTTRLKYKYTAILELNTIQIAIFEIWFKYDSNTGPCWV